MTTSGGRRRGWLVCAGVAVVVAGCTTTHAVRPGELARLDGFDVEQPAQSKVAIQTLDGPGAFDAWTRLQMDLPGYRIDERFTRIEVSGGELVGQTREGTQIHAPLDQIRAARLE